MRPLSIQCLLLLFVCSLCQAQSYQRIETVRDAPFSAQAKQTDQTAQSTQIQSFDFARARDGSLYTGSYDFFGEFAGSLGHISIDDVTKGCNIQIHPYQEKLKQFSTGLQSETSEGLSIRLKALKQTVAPTVEELRQKEKQTVPCKVPSNSSDNSSRPPIYRNSELGQKSVDGLLLTGHHMEHPGEGDPDRIEEYWVSEFGFPYSWVTKYLREGKTHSFQMSGVKLDDPPAELFTIQDKYFPQTRTLPLARTIYVGKMPDNEELRRRIVEIITASGRFKLAEDRNAADLVINNTSMLENNSSAATQYFSLEPSYSKLATDANQDVQQRTFSILFQLSFDQGEIWERSPVVNRCLVEFWKRVEAQPLPAE